MLQLYVAPSSASSRKAKAWLRNHKIPFMKRNINDHPLNANEIEHLLCLSDNGSSDLISTRSNIYKKLTDKMHVDLDSLPLNKLIALMIKYPDLLRRPIMFAGSKLEIGYNREEIRKFLPHSYRKVELKKLENALGD